jgi:hypothetical protein
VGIGREEQHAQEGSCKLFWNILYTEPGTALPNLIPGSPDYKAGVCHPAEDLAMVEVFVIDGGRVFF